VDVSSSQIQLSYQQDPAFTRLDKKWKLKKNGKICAKIEVGDSVVLVISGDVDDDVMHEEIRRFRTKATPSKIQNENPKNIDDPEDSNIQTVILANAHELEFLSEEEPESNSGMTMVADPNLASSASILATDAVTGISEAVPEKFSVNIPAPAITDVNPKGENQMLADSDPKSMMTSLHNMLPSTDQPVVITEEPVPEPVKSITPKPNKRTSWDPKPKPMKKPDTRDSTPRGRKSWDAKPVQSTANESNALVPSRTPRKSWEPNLGDETSKRAYRNKWGDSVDGQNRVAEDTSSAPRQPLATKKQNTVNSSEEFVIRPSQLVGASNDAALQVLIEPDGEFSNAIRVLAARINDLSTTHGHRIFVISSALPITGKTTTAMNLALAMAEDPNRKVALIEADFRNPKVGDILQANNCPGLINVIEDNVDPKEIILRFEGRNLISFVSGGRHKSPSTLLASPNFKSLLQTLSSTVDVAIIDAPSILLYADANVLLSQADSAILVALENYTKSTHLNQAIKQIGEDKVSGLIYNRLTRHQFAVTKAMRKIRMSNS